MQKYQSTALKSLIRKIYVFVILGFTLWGCNPTKHIPEGQIYLRANKIKIAPKIAEEEEFTPFIRQRANSKSLWIVKYKMQQYLSFDAEKAEEKNEKKRAKHDLKNEKRIAKGNDPKEFKPAFAKRMMESGEAPVIYSENAVEQTITQFEKMLFNKGYFKNKVYSELKYNADSNKVTVIYSADAGPQYKWNKISLVIDDPNLTQAIKEANALSTFHKGDPYNTDIIDQERSRFTSAMRNQGYFYFSKENIVFEVDSNIDGNLVNLKTIIKNPSVLDPNSDTAVVTFHKKYKIGEITLNTSFDPNYKDHPEDSIHFENLVYINLSRLKYKPYTFVNKLFFATGDTYSQRAQERTYSRISGLNNFSYINIGFIPDPLDSNILDCNILMTPLASQSVGTELEGTHSDGNLGFSGYLTYQHRNVFGGAEAFRFRIKGGAEAQQTNTSGQALNDGLFNTLELGGEASLIFQKLILPKRWQSNILKSFNRPKTSVNFIINYQDRPDFERGLINTSMGLFASRKKKNTNEILWYPIDLSYIDIEKDAAFEERLKELNNPLLDATYSNQFIAGTRILETWTNRENLKQKSFVLNRAQLELAGNILSLFNRMNKYEEVLDSNGNVTDTYHTIANIRYAQFVKIQNEWHLTRRINRNQSMAYKIMGGIGIPYGNANSLPYDRSFYGGGANGNRGWRARTLGPGSLPYDDESKIGVDQVADIKIQLSTEYRFHIIKSMEGAIFADVGNIWLKDEDPTRPNAHFDINRFYKELAVSLGPGVRFNFGFLLVRFDWGFKIYDPSLEEGNRWVFSNGDYLNNLTIPNDAVPNNTSKYFYEYSTFNLGIGYPF